jgi:chromosome segregation ATPase
LEYVKELPEPLSANLYGQFIGCLQYPNESLQVAQLKVVMRQLPELNRNIFMQVLRALSTVEQRNKLNHTSIKMLARLFSSHLIWDPSEDDFGQIQSHDTVTLVQLMLDNFVELAEAVQGGSALRNRASRAGVVPDTVTTQIGKGQTHLTPIIDHEVKSLVNSLPPIFDEGLAAVKQLSDSNDALQTLVQRMGGSLQAFDSVSSDVKNLQKKMVDIEHKHTSLAQDVEDKLLILESNPSSDARNLSAADFDDKIASLEHKVEAWIQVVQTRLDNIESSNPDEDDASTTKKVTRNEIDEMVQSALKDALEIKDHAHQESMVAWQKQVEADFSKWKKETMEEAAKVVASHITTVNKRLDSLLADSEGKKSDSHEVQSEEISKLKKTIESVSDSEERLNGRIDDLMRSVEDLAERFKACESEDLSLKERLNKLNKELETAVKQQPKQEQAESSPDEGTQTAISQLQEEVSKIEPLQSGLDSIKKAQEVLKSRVEEVESRLSALGSEEEGARLSEVLDELESVRETFASDHLTLQGRVEQIESAQQAMSEGHQSAQASVLSLSQDLDKIKASLAERISAQTTTAEDSKLPSTESIEEAFGTMFAEHVSPEIATLREAVFALQTLVGKPSGHSGEWGFWWLNLPEIDHERGRDSGSAPASATLVPNTAHLNPLGEMVCRSGHPPFLTPPSHVAVKAWRPRQGTRTRVGTRAGLCWTSSRV